MASQHEWPRFTFFDRDAQTRSNVESFTHELSEQSANIYATSAANGMVAVGDSIGRVHLLDAKWHARTFSAYYRCISHLKLTSSQQSVLITIGDDEQSSNPLLKVWTQLDKPVDDRGRPLCASTIIATPHGSGGGKTSASLFRREVVTCFDVHESLGFIAIGFNSGSVLLIRGDITKDRHRKQQIIHEGTLPVTGIAFTPGLSGKGDATLFFATLGGIYSGRIALRDVGVQRIDQSHAGRSNAAADSEGQNNRNCSCITDLSLDMPQFVVGHRRGFAFYMPDGPGAFIAFEGEKILVQWTSSGYLVSLSLPRNPGTDGNSSAGGSFTSVGGDMQQLMVYDVKNKFIAYSAEVQDVHHIFAEWGSLFLVTRTEGNKTVDGSESSPKTSIIELREKEFTEKLEVLERKNQYSLAITLARRHNYDEEGLVGIFRKYGDHLYDKHAYDDAVRQYISTVGNRQIYLEPSYVIRKFLDAQRVNNLTTYLEALHKKNVASEDHTTLLLNCYTKQKAVDKLNDFIAPLNNRPAEYSFNTDTAIRVLRQAGYYELALRLAKLRERHGAYMSIQLDDVKNYDDALQYLRTLDFDSCLRIMDESGKMLMNNAPSATCELLKNLCTDYDMPIQSNNVADRAMNEHHFRAADEDFLLRSGSPAVAAGGRVSEVPPIRHEPRRANPLRFMHLFVDHPDEMLDFVEYLLLYFQEDPAQVSNELRTALLDLYLKKFETLASSPGRGNENRSSLENKIMKLLEETCQQQQQTFINDAETDSADDKAVSNVQNAVDMRQRAIVFCQTHKFARGLLYLYEQLGDYDAILQHYINSTALTHETDDAVVDSDTDAAILNCCRRFGERNDNLWITAMLHFARNYRPERSAALAETLEHIEKRKLRAPIWIVDQLCGVAGENETVSASTRSNAALPAWPTPIGLVKQLILRQLRQDEQRIAEADAVIDKYRADTEQLRRELAEIEAGPLVFQASLCSWCNMPLEESTTSVHFLCKHSFHKSCFDNYRKDDSAAECLKCRGENRAYMDRIRRQRESGDVLQHRFKTELEAAFRQQQPAGATTESNKAQDVFVGGAADGFTTIAEFFGRGVFPHNPRSSAVLAKQSPSITHR